MINSSVPLLDEQRRIVVYLDGLHVKVNALRELQSASGEELSALMAQFETAEQINKSWSIEKEKR